ncbi:Histone tail methylase [Phaffia rhodozyma]|uniref:Histone tail methylase n=1 Tax=Phaffia rhodozyma TaxID=264483 RepID=A0A0F7SLQ7_PHARH|nr:Histone tail methylase [Phaffia rhodozyma]
MVPVYRNQAHLKEDDDFLSHVLLDVFGTAPGTKLGVHKCDQLGFVPPKVNMRTVLAIVKEHIIGHQDIPSAIGAFLRIPGVRQYLEPKVAQDRKRLTEFQTHLEHYLLIYCFETAIDIGRTPRYSHVSGKTELAIYATKEISKRTKLTYHIRGSLAPLSRREEDEMSGFDSNLYHHLTDLPATVNGQATDRPESSPVKGSGKKLIKLKERAGKGSQKASGSSLASGRAMRDFSVVWSTALKRNELFLGPARFLNHDCRPNTILCKTEHGISFETVRNILPGEELTAYYGDDYFGPKNDECLCASCEYDSKGWYSKQSSTRSLSSAFTSRPPADDQDFFTHTRTTRSTHSREQNSFPNVRFSVSRKGKEREDAVSFLVEEDNDEAWFCRRCKGALEEVDPESSILNLHCVRCIRHRKIFGLNWPYRPIPVKRPKDKKRTTQEELSKANTTTEEDSSLDCILPAVSSEDLVQWAGEIDSDTDEIDPCLPLIFALDERIIEVPPKPDPNAPRRPVPPDRPVQLPYDCDPPPIREVIVDHNRKLHQTEVTIQDRTAVVSRDFCSSWIQLDSILFLAGLTKRNINKVFASLHSGKKHPYSARPGEYSKPPTWQGVWVSLPTATQFSQRYGVQYPLSQILLPYSEFKRLCQSLFPEVTLNEDTKEASMEQQTSRSVLPREAKAPVVTDVDVIEMSDSSDLDRSDQHLPIWLEKHFPLIGKTTGGRKIKSSRPAALAPSSSDPNFPSKRKALDSPNGKALSHSTSVPRRRRELDRSRSQSPLSRRDDFSNPGLFHASESPPVNNDIAVEPFLFALPTINNETTHQAVASVAMSSSNRSGSESDSDVPIWEAFEFERPAHSESLTKSASRPRSGWRPVPRPTKDLNNGSDLNDFPPLPDPRHKPTGRKASSKVRFTRHPTASSLGASALRLRDKRGMFRDNPFNNGDSRASPQKDRISDRANPTLPSTNSRPRSTRDLWAAFRTTRPADKELMTACLDDSVEGTASVSRDGDEEDGGEDEDERTSDLFGDEPGGEGDDEKDGDEDKDDNDISDHGDAWTVKGEEKRESKKEEHEEGPAIEDVYPAIRPVAPDPDYFVVSDTSDSDDLEVTSIYREVECIFHGGTMNDPLVLSD